MSEGRWSEWFEYTAATVQGREFRALRRQRPNIVNPSLTFEQDADADYLNSLERDLQEALAALREIVDSADLHNAEVEGTDICDCEVVDYHARIAAVLLARHRKEDADAS